MMDKCVPMLRASSVCFLIVFAFSAEAYEASLVDFYSFSGIDIHGNEVSFEKFRGQVTLVVNVASECGYTDNHYRGLNKLHNLFAKTGKFNILAFPCNQFGNQEPGTNAEIYDFAYNTMGARFLLFSKIDVKGNNVPESWRYLTGSPPKCFDSNPQCESWAARSPSECEVNPGWMKSNCRRSCNTCKDKGESQRPNWNFWKYLVNTDGHLISACGPNVVPDDILGQIETLLHVAGVNREGVRDEF